MLDGRPQSSLSGNEPDANDSPGEAEDLDQLADALTELAAHLNAGEHRFLVLLERFDRQGGHLGVGIRSTAHWLQWKFGTGSCPATTTRTAPW